MISNILDNINIFILKNNSLDVEYFKTQLNMITDEEISNIKGEMFKGPEKISPLEFAILTGDISLIERFITTELINLKSDDNRSYPLFVAIWGGDLTSTQRFEIVSLLLKTGADPNVENRMGESPLNKAVALSEMQDLVPLLIKFGAKDEYNKYYNTHQTILQKWLGDSKISHENKRKVEEYLKGR